MENRSDTLALWCTISESIRRRKKSRSTRNSNVSFFSLDIIRVDLTIPSSRSSVLSWAGRGVRRHQTAQFCHEKWGAHSTRAISPTTRPLFVAKELLTATPLRAGEFIFYVHLLPFPPTFAVIVKNFGESVSVTSSSLGRVTLNCSKDKCSPYLARAFPSLAAVKCC